MAFQTPFLFHGHKNRIVALFAFHRVPSQRLIPLRFSKYENHLEVINYESWQFYIKFRFMIHV